METLTIRSLRVLASSLLVLCASLPTLAAPPINDNYADRIAIAGSPVTVFGTNVEATRETGEPIHHSNGTNSVWWSWLAPSSGAVTIDTIGSNFDTLLAVYTGSAVNALTYVASDDDSGGSAQSLLKMTTQADTRYRIAVAGFAGATGDIVLNIAPSSVPLIQVGSTWKYLDNGSDQGVAWRTNSFNDATWASGPAQLGYGDGDEATIVSFGGNNQNKYTTTYFRQSFNVADPSVFTALTLRLLRDDGAVVYLNGVEIARQNMPTGPILFNTFASGPVGQADESAYFESTVNASLLRAGGNLVAVEIHQSDLSSSDVSFDLALLGNTSQVINSVPSASISNPLNNTAYNDPATITINAVGSDTDGTVAKIEFFQGTTKIGEDTSSPYSYVWSGMPVGTYALRAVAVDNLDARGTSAVVNVTVNVSSPPTIFNKTPAPSTVNMLTNVSVNFSEPVSGVDASDFLVNGNPATSVSGSGSNYVFTFPQPNPGLVFISWDGSHGIRDFENPPRNFDGTSAGATWSYNFVDTMPPVLISRDPPAGATLASLSQVVVRFNEAVDGVDAADLRINNAPASSVSGSGMGPYTFTFSQPATGAVSVVWAAGHGIRDRAATPNQFAGGSWTYNLDPNASFTTVVINEIMYHPASELPAEEYVELHNNGTSPVNLTGWKLNRGVDFVFPNVTINPGGYLVVAANVPAFNARYPGVNVIGGWTGRLSNGRDAVELENADGDRIDIVEYADEGDFALRRRWPLDTRGWEWFAEHDGLGRSLELMNPALPNNSGQNWGASLVNNGTPGAVNSVFSSNIAPLIRDLQHSPAVPKSTDPVLISAKITDEILTGLNVYLLFRNASSSTPPAFSTNRMFDDGFHNDGAAGDGLYAATLPPTNNGVVIEFYVQAIDSGGRARTFPAAAQEVGGALVQAANAIYQVDDSVYTGNQPVYRIIMTESERAQLEVLNRNSDAQMNVTFITIEGDNTSIRYNGGIRYRGASSRGRNPPGYRLNIPTDRPWHDVTEMNLNSQFAHAQLMGAAISQKAGLPAANARAIQLRVNGLNPGTYVHVEVLNGEWAGHHFPNDGGGNVYKAAGHNARLTYPAPGDAASFRSLGYEKSSNASENDWSDLAALTFALDEATTPPEVYVAAVRQNVNVDLWMRYFAVLSLLEYTETSLGSGFGDDYSLYRGVVDPRFMPLPHDYDTILGEGDTPGNPNESIFIAEALPVISRFLHHPEFEPLYFAELRRQLNTTFSTNQMYPLLDQILGDWVGQQTINNMKAFVANRNAGVLAQLPPEPTPAVVATISDEPLSPTYQTSARLTVGGTGVTHYRYKLNSGAYSAETPVSSPIVLSGLANGTYTVSVIGRNAAGTYQAEAAATLSQTWAVNSSLARVVLNEVLARNDGGFTHSGTSPDAIELFNARNVSVDLSGMGLTDDPTDPYKYSLPPGTILTAGSYLVILADNPNGTPGLHAGFSLGAEGETLYLYDSVARGGLLVDSIAFGPQLSDRSIGRLASGNWGLANPTLGTNNVPAVLGSVNALKINEWLADGVPPLLEDFIEIYNTGSQPVNMGGLYLTDNPIGFPARHQIAPLSFIEANSYAVFIADGNTNGGPEHVNFNLAAEFGTIGLLTKNLASIDCVVYVQQRPGKSQGRYPAGGPAISFLDQPTPGGGNPRPNAPPVPQLVNLVPLSASWKYDESNQEFGTAWRAPNFVDALWPEGQASLGVENSPLAEPIRTPLRAPSSGGPLAAYFRTRFTLPAGVPISGLQITHLIDDGAVFYLNGVEAYRYAMPAGEPNVTTLANSGPDATLRGPFTISLDLLVPGENVLAVEVHQSSPGSTDVVFAMRLDATILSNNPTAGGLVINEVLADNATIAEANGAKPDWVELYNPTGSPIDLSDMSLTDQISLPRRWVFPPGSLIPGGEYFRIRLDPDAPMSATNTGFGLSASGDAVYLLNRPAAGSELLDSISFGMQLPDLSVGRLPNGASNWNLTLPTIGAGNVAATLGNPALLKINEWMASPSSGEDWFEVYNPSAQPVALGGLHLSDDLTLAKKFPIQALTFIGTGPRAFQRFEADNEPVKGPEHVNFKLSGDGESLTIATTNGVLIHRIDFGRQTNGISQGLLPDGSANTVYFTQTASPGSSNYLPLETVVINEALTHSDLPLEDAIELRNLTGSPINVGGWFLSDEKNFLQKFRIPDGFTIPGNSYRVLYEYQFNPVPLDPNSFALSSSKGDQIHLSATAGGLLTGYRSVVEFDAAANGVSFGRYITSDGRSEFVAMANRTFGVDNPETVGDFRGGNGLPNSAPKVGPIVINRIMYHPPEINVTNDNTLDEYIELLNTANTNVALFHPAFPTNRWRLRDAVSFEFPAATTLAPNARIVVVSFDPASNPSTLAAFRSKYNLAPTVAVVGPWTGKLDNSNDKVELYRPDAPQTAPSDDAGFVPYILVERIHYFDRAPWAAEPDGTGAALQRANTSLFGNDPINWISNVPSGSTDTDGDGMPNSWELQYNLNPNSAADASIDSDGDGLSNLEEYQAGTSPRDAASTLRFVIVNRAPLTLQFTTAPDKSYSILYRNSLATGAWQLLQNVPAESTPRTVQVMDPAASATRFYQIQSPALP